MKVSNCWKSHAAAHLYSVVQKTFQTFFSFSGPPSKRTYKPVPSRTVTRQRPYKDPYMPVSRDDYDQWERDSVVSHWSVGDDVRHILYDDVASSIVSIRL